MLVFVWNNRWGDTVLIPYLIVASIPILYQKLYFIPFKIILKMHLTGKNLLVKWYESSFKNLWGTPAQQIALIHFERQSVMIFVH